MDSTVTTQTEENKALVRRFIDEIFLKRDFASVDELLTEDFTPHTWGPMPPGREGLKSAITRVSAGISDAHMSIDDMIAEGDRVAVRLTSSAVQSGEFMGCSRAAGATRSARSTSSESATAGWRSTGTRPTSSA